MPLYKSIICPHLEYFRQNGIEMVKDLLFTVSHGTRTTRYALTLFGSRFKIKRKLFHTLWLHLHETFTAFD